MVSIFGKSRAEAASPRELVEIDWEGPGAQAETGLNLKIFGIEKFADVDSVLDALRNKDNMIVMKIRSSLSTDKMEVKRAIRRVQKTAYALGGDMIGLSEELILVAPPSVTIDRSRVQSAPTPESASETGTDTY